MRGKKKGNSPDGFTMGLFVSFQKLFRTLDFGRSLRGRAPVLTMRQMQVLSFFNEAEVVHISEVSRALSMSIQSVNNLVKRLEVMGYVERTQNSRDKRLSDIRFTKKGRKGFDVFRAAQFGILRSLVQELGGEERARVLQSVAYAAELFERAAVSAAAKAMAPAGR